MGEVKREKVHYSIAIRLSHDWKQRNYNTKGTYTTEEAGHLVPRLYLF